MKYDKYKVYVHVNGEEWGEYDIFAPNRETAAFGAGIKYTKEEPPIPFGTYIVIDVIPDQVGI